MISCKPLPHLELGRPHQSKKVNISKPPRCNKKDVGRKKKKSSIDYKAEWDTLSLPDRAHHFQVYSAAVVSADDIAIYKTLLVTSPTKETPLVVAVSLNCDVEYTSL
jgi:hypothetical protein